MCRYFFDLVSNRRSEYDYRGCELHTPEHALLLGELIAIDLGFDADADWHGWTVSVRNTHGRQLHAIPVPAAA